MKSTHLVICLLFMSFISGSSQAQDKDEIARELCKQVFGSLPKSESIRIHAKADKLGQLCFYFSLPKKQKLVGVNANHDFSSSFHAVGRAGVTVTVMPLHPEGIRNNIERLNAKLILLATEEANRKAEAAGSEIRGLTKGSERIELVKLPTFARNQYGFHVENAYLIPMKHERRKILASEMSHVFSKCKFLEIEQQHKTGREFWDLYFRVTPFWGKTLPPDGKRDFKEKN